MFANDFVLAPDRPLRPAYNISPFSTSDIAANRDLPFADEIDDYFRARFPGRSFLYCESGRSAIRLALRQLRLASTDLVTILTTTGNFYISGCVTREIESICRWSRRHEPETKVLFVNHEFGFPFEPLRALSKSALPIIEDAAHSFASNNLEQSVNQVGCFTVYSFPKFFPIQAGALLVFDPAYQIPETIDLSFKRYLQKVLSAQLKQIDCFCDRRWQNHHSLAARFQSIGWSPRFQPSRGPVPGVFMFRTDPAVDLPALKTFMWDHGIESSVFYGEQAFFIPVHHRLAESDLDYFFEVARSFLDPSRRRAQQSSA